MTLNGFTPTTLAPILLIIAVIVAILYLLRMRRRMVKVAYIGLWRDVIESASKRRFHDWLKRLVSFLLWMAIVGLIAVALLDPRQEDDTSAQRHAVIILDASASMMAEDPDSACGTRFACARDEAQALIDAMKPTDRAVIIEASGIVSAVSGPFSSDKAMLSRTLERLSASASAADMAKAVELAVSLSQNRINSEIFLLTDGQFDNSTDLSQKIPRTTAFEERVFGAPTGNLYIEAFNVRRTVSNRLAFEVFFKVHNGFDMPVKARLKIVNLGENETVFDASSEHTAISEKTITLASGSSEMRLYENLTLGSRRMAALVEIESPAEAHDTLLADNIAYAQIPDYAKPDILCVTPGNLFLEAALLLNENYRVTFVKPSEISTNGTIELPQISASHDIVILDNSYRNLGAVTLDEWQGRAIFINPESSWSPYKFSSADNPIIERVNSKHPIARWLSLKNLNIARGEVFSGIRSDDMIMRAIEGPIMAAQKTETRRILAIGFSLVESDLIFRVGLPILFINAVDWMMDENSDPLRGYPAGSSYHISVAGNASRVDVIRPDGTRISGLPVYDGAATVYGPQAGFYRVLPDNSKDKETEFAANFLNAAESDLGRPAALISGRDTLKPTLAQDTDDDGDTSLIVKILSGLPSTSQYIWVLVLLIALGLITAEWLTYHRRWTV